MKKILFSFTFLLSCITIRAQWNSDPNAGAMPIIATVAEESRHFSLPDGINGAIEVSQSFDFINFPFTSNITAQRVNKDGLLQWGTSASPKLVFSLSSDTEFISLSHGISDGNGGVYIAWQTLADTFSNIFMQHINSSGDILWAAAGVKINHDNDRSANSIKLCQDGSNGVVLVWDESIYDSAITVNRTTFSQIYAQRYNSAGAKQWGANGVQVCTAPGLRAGATLINDGNGGFIICFGDARNSTQLPNDIFNNIDIYAQRLNMNGALTWAANGLPVVTTALNQVPTGAFSDVGNSSISDGANGAILLFQQYILDKGDSAKYFAQRINGSGAVQWGTSGALVCNIDSSKQVIKVVSDGAGGMVADWNDGRSASASNSIYAQRVLANGTVNWAADGVNILPATDSINFYGNDMTDDGTGNYIFTWTNNTASASNIKAQKINNSGLIQWGAGGKPVCNNPLALPKSPSIVKSDNGTAIISWIDSRGGFMNSTDVYAAKIAANGSLVGPTVSITYTFHGNGNWDVASNWSNSSIPPASLPSGSSIVINPSAGGQCVLNVAQTISSGATLTVQTGKKLVVQGALNIQ